MPRIIRIQHQGASYHIMSRGNKYGPIYLSDRDRALIIDPDETEYFLTVSEYTHLNPARAGLLDRNNPRLSRYPWGSYPYCLKPPEKRPSWLRVEKVFQELKILEDTTGGRKKYSQIMNLRVKEVLNPKNKRKLEKEWISDADGTCETIRLKRKC